MVALHDIARQAMIERGFIPDFSKEVELELASINAPAASIDASYRDMREAFWVSIDNENSLDLDQLTYAEKNFVYVAIADVDALVKKGLPIDRHAAHNTTSIYVPSGVFPMLPVKLSNDLTSLNERKDRLAMVVEMEIGENGKFHLKGVYPAIVRNQAKLNYRNVSACLEKGMCLGHLMPSLPGLKKQLELQDRLARRILAFREAQGALEFGISELEAVVVNGIPVGLQERVRSRGHLLIENFMIAANVCVTEYLHQHKIPTLRRVVKTPRRWNRIVVLAKSLGAELPPKPDAKSLRAFLIKQKIKEPLFFSELSLAIIKLIGRGEYILSTTSHGAVGHFNLAEVEYAHTTAPNRRYPDIIMQRLLKSLIFGKPLPYNRKELAGIAARCTLKETDAEKVERRLNKCAAAMVLSKQIGRSFKAMVTGATDRGVWIRLLEYPVEGKLIKGGEGLDVGDYLNAQLIHVDIVKGYIDFSLENYTNRIK